MNNFIIPQWPAPSTIKAYTSTRLGGVSLSPYHEFNLGDHVDDDPQSVVKNRALLRAQLTLTNEPMWMRQTHSTIALAASAFNKNKEADAIFTHEANQVCAILTADCLPILLCNRQGTHIAAIHAGWRGLANGVIESTLKALSLPADELLVWLGPAISQSHFEVGPEVRERFLQTTPAAEQAFVPSPSGRWLANLYLLARLRLEYQGIHAIYGGDYCTYADEKRFFSYRRDGQKTGRMVSLIWMV